MFDFSLMDIVAGLPGLIIALVIHEYAHAQVAVALGDYTPKMMGRLTLDPRAHIDPIGLLMLFIIRFGWAKPVMINPNNFKKPRRDDILVSAAGPAANLLVAFIGLIFMVIYLKLGLHMSTGLRQVLTLIMIYNINFAIFNMIPIPPLDGSHIVENLLPPNLAYQYAKLERYGFLILIVMMMTPVLTYVLVPLQRLILQLFNFILFIFL